MSLHEWDADVEHIGFVKVQSVTTLPGSTSSADKRKIIYTTDTDKYYISDGSNWKEIHPDHNDLGNIQGGNSSQRYHLTYTRQLAIVNASPDATSGNPVVTESYIDNRIAFGGLKGEYGSGSPFFSPVAGVYIPYEAFSGTMSYYNTTPNIGLHNIRVDADGTYKIIFDAYIDTTSTTDLFLQLRQNGSTAMATTAAMKDEEEEQICFHTLYALDSGDNVSVYYKSADSLDTWYAHLSVERVGPKA